MFFFGTSKGAGQAALALVSITYTMTTFQLLRLWFYSFDSTQMEAFRLFQKYCMKNLSVKAATPSNFFMMNCK